MITNVVCHADLQCRIDLKQLDAANSVYNPRRFPAVIWKHKDIGGTCMVFENGKLMVNGKVSSVKAAKQRVRRYARCLQQMGWNVTLRNIEISTISASFKVE